jgi:peptidyl-prolyl cis-trans isomerase D
MLQNIGDKLKGTGADGKHGSRWVWYTIIGALALVFIMWGPYSMFELTSTTSGYAAKVNGEKISSDELNRMWQRQQPRLIQAFGGELTEPQRQIYQQSLLDSAVRGLAVSQYANQLGYGVSEAQLKRAFQNEEAFKVDGKFNLQAARARLAEEGVTEDGYLTELRRDQLTNQLLGSVGISSFFTPAEARRILALLDEEREVRFVLLQPQDFAGSAPIAPEAIEAWYKAHPEEFAVAESVQLAYAELSLADVAAGIKVTDEQLRARYEQDKASYVSPETRRARHILIAVDAPADDAKAKAQAQDLYKQLQGGADFAKLAQQFSKDASSAAKGGDLDWAGREVYDKEFSDKLFSLKQGETSEPVKTQFGYHIIRLEGIRASTGRGFEEVRAELAALVRNELAAVQFGTTQDRLQERLETAGVKLDELVTEFSMRRGEVARFERGAGGLPLGSDAELNRDVFSDASLTQRRVGGPLPLGEERMVIFQVEAHSPASTKPLDQVRADVIKAITRERGAEAAYAAAETAVADLDKGANFAQVAARLKAKTEGPRFVSRGSPDLPVQVRDALFAAARPENGKPVRKALKIDDGGAALFEATRTQAQTMLGNPQLVDIRSRRELDRYTRRDIEAYLADVVGSAKVRKNPQAFQQ